MKYKVTSILVLSGLLWWIGRFNDGEAKGGTRSGSSIVDALRIHEPSLRIFRSLLEINLLFFCAAFLLHTWLKIATPKEVQSTMFQSIEEQMSGAPSITVTPYEYEPTNEAERGEDPGSDIVEDWEPIATEDEDLSHIKSLPSKVFQTALDMLVLILVTLFLYTIATFEYLESIAGASSLATSLSRIAAPTFPLLLFLLFLYKAFVPWKQRGPIWIVFSMTVAAPWSSVSFRDGFIGDVFTSSVRPMQDIAFTIVYLFSGLRGYWGPHQYGDFIHSADATLERSWILHTVILPCCMVSPLWWRFLQNLRQTYEEKERWPYLGNALKYFLAAQVAVLAVFHPQHKKTAWWILSFIGATLYQVWWDVYMDWNLIGRGGLRRKRRFSGNGVYYAIALINFVLRFCSLLSILPPRYLSSAGVLTNTFAGGPIVASAEIIRRTLWAILRFEWEVVKRTGNKEMDDENMNIELRPMKIDGTSSALIRPVVSPLSDMNEVQVLGELAAYAAVFGVLGFIAAAHRETA